MGRKSIADYLNKESGFVQHALSEFIYAGWMDEDGKFNDEMQEMLCLNILELLEVFSEQGHSGFSAPYLIAVLETLMKFEPLTPLTGSDDEWVDHGGGHFQNKRCSRVFKQPDRFGGQAYDLEGKVFRKDGVSFTCGDSLVPVSFPYAPQVEYVDLNSSEEKQEG
jgi:hypothetical protein